MKKSRLIGVARACVFTFSANPLRRTLMKKQLASAFCVFMLSGYCMQAQATLVLLGQGTSAHGTYRLIYDSGNDVTWYDYSASRNSWDNQMAWADSLSVIFEGNTFTDWRLPVRAAQSCTGAGCTLNEMEDLYYTELGNTGGAGNFTSTGDFQNIIAHNYWSGTEYAGRETTNAWFFSTYDGGYNDLSKTYQGYALAVHPGQLSAVVPVPAAVWLFGSGLLGLFGMARRKKA